MSPICLFVWPDKTPGHAIVWPDNTISEIVWPDSASARLTCAA
jgi:hypothetical protein